MRWSIGDLFGAGTFTMVRFGTVVGFLVQAGVGSLRVVLVGASMLTVAGDAVTFNCVGCLAGLDWRGYSPAGGPGLSLFSAPFLCAAAKRLFLLDLVSVFLAAAKSTTL